MARKKGTDLELVVAAIEKALEPSCVVKHDQYLSVLTSTEGHKRQCDVVIYSGSKRRPIVTIVEVQDRNSSVSVGTYDGWVSKRDEVGANQLICVSRKPFPKSVIEKARQQGTRVSLIELSAGVPDELPLGFINFHYQYADLMSENEIIVNALIPSSYKDKVTLQEFENISNIEWKKRSFKNNENIDVSVYDVLLKVLENIHLEKNIIHTSSCCFSFFQNTELRLLVYIRGESVPVLLNVELNNYKYEFHRFLMDVAVYRTTGKGDDGWFFEARHDSAKGPMSVKVPIIRHEESGGYVMLDVIADVPFDFSQNIIEI
ncbi:hypothetical protein MSP8887_03693 [Marinomonas spartinae]|uniref:hypothetical protein n=1 Tax=Marinomonas spartinae TaxID=1792290 RepID=UPI000808BA23|nr:hypothetical protein [Marinomonas spartinae]SBS39177.1 hypothetical protein MSP8887_03693 [Marinomonas spartinae]